MSNTEILQFAPFTSALDGGFWYQLTKRKLDVFKLDDKAVRFSGFYSINNFEGLPPIVNIDYSAFDLNVQLSPYSFPLTGDLIITNTLEDFKLKDKKELLQSFGSKVWDEIKAGTSLENPSNLQRLLCLTFADLKKYHYYYWVAFPALTYPETVKLDQAKSIESYFTSDQLSQFLDSYDILSSQDKMAFLVILDEEKCHTARLNEYQSLLEKNLKILLGFADPSTYDSHPGWPLRNILALVAYHWAEYQVDWDIVCFRENKKDGKRHFQHSIVLSVHLKIPAVSSDCPNVVGWEKNQGKLAPRKVDMSASMDPKRLADAAVDLNLKLMRWRLIPDLELENIKSTSCLLFGAGTLGCSVARCLMGWGVRKISLLDNSSVSYSNPVRQSLFTFEHCLQGGSKKAIAAAESLKSIFPGVDAEGHVINVPMPGHEIPKKAVQETLFEISRIENLIETHDVIFLLMDTRESRWLPSLIGAAKGKIVMNAALGFDTFLVMRHGMKKNGLESCGDGLPPRIVEGSELGCYFCNDVVAPGNSTHDRTLDQQCTVTRPGVSYVAAALAVELMISVIQHPKRGLAPASTLEVSDICDGDLSTALGTVPHQIRGHLDRFQNTILTSKAFDRCTACSYKVLEKYREEGHDFLLKVFNDPNYLEDVTGLTELMANINADDVYELSDDSI